jgi:hypothetical protein
MQMSNGLTCPDTACRKSCTLAWHTLVMNMQAVFFYRACLRLVAGPLLGLLMSHERPHFTLQAQLSVCRLACYATAQLPLIMRAGTCVCARIP